jgi:hypothetical protein
VKISFSAPDFEFSEITEGILSTVANEAIAVWAAKSQTKQLTPNCL